MIVFFGLDHLLKSYCLLYRWSGGSPYKQSESHDMSIPAASWLPVLWDPLSEMTCCPAGTVCSPATFLEAGLATKFQDNLVVYESQIPGAFGGPSLWS